jgi:carbon monoxide dehydrogenase subunit G
MVASKADEMVDLKVVMMVERGWK